MKLLSPALLAAREWLLGLALTPWRIEFFLAFPLVPRFTVLVLLYMVLLTVPESILVYDVAYCTSCPSLRWLLELFSVVGGISPGEFSRSWCII